MDKRYYDVAMNLTIIEIESHENFKTPALRKRAEESFMNKKTKQYKVLHRGREVAFLALDRRPDVKNMVIYEIFVPRHERRKGIATVLLRKIEQICVQEGLPIIRVHPLPFEKNLTEKELLEWYYKQGYVHDNKVTGELYKVITAWPDKMVVY